MKPVVFQTRLQPRAAELFKQWRLDHTPAYYLNAKSARRGMLHREPCSHVGAAGQWDPSGGDVTKRAKVCATSRNVLSRGAETQQPVFTFTLCSNCLADT